YSRVVWSRPYKHHPPWLYADKTSNIRRTFVRVARAYGDPRVQSVVDRCCRVSARGLRHIQGQLCSRSRTCANVRVRSVSGTLSAWSKPTRVEPLELQTGAAHDVRCTTPSERNERDLGWRWLPTRELSAVEEFGVQGRPVRFLIGLGLVLSVLLI